MGSRNERRKSMKPFHVSFEGTSGAGKSTQARILVKRLCDYGIPTEYVKNPNGTAFSRVIMDAILTQSPCKLAEIFAFAACFCQVTSDLMLPALKKGICVVSDRGIGSAYAHALYRCEGSIAEDLFDRIILEINKENMLFADLTFLLMFPVEKGVLRKEKDVNKNRLDALSPDSIREALAFSKLSKKFPGWVTINADDHVNAVSEQIWTYIEQLIGGRTNER